MRNILLLLASGLLLCSCTAPQFNPKDVLPEVRVNPSGAQFADAVDVIFLAIPLEATIYYTTDGSAPTTESTVYENNEIRIEQSTDLRFFAAFNDQQSASYIERYVIIYTDDPAIEGNENPSAEISQETSANPPPENPGNETASSPPEATTP